jgi:hypothetical protein
MKAPALSVQNVIGKVEYLPEARVSGGKQFRFFGRNCAGQ